METNDGSDKIMVVDNMNPESFLKFLKEMANADWTNAEEVQAIADKYRFGNDTFDLYPLGSEIGDTFGVGYCTGYGDWDGTSKVLGITPIFQKGGSNYVRGYNLAISHLNAGYVNIYNPQVIYRANNPVYTQDILKLLFK